MKNAGPSCITPDLAAKPDPETDADGPAGPILPQPRLSCTGAGRIGHYPHPEPRPPPLQVHHLRPHLRRDPRHPARPQADRPPRARRVGEYSATLNGSVLSGRGSYKGGNVRGRCERSSEGPILPALGRQGTDPRVGRFDRTDLPNPQITERPDCQRRVISAPEDAPAGGAHGRGPRASPPRRLDLPCGARRCNPPPLWPGLRGRSARPARRSSSPP